MKKRFVNTNYRMITRKMKTALLCLFILSSFIGYAQNPVNDVTVIGAMKNVMWKGELEGNIHLDSIADKTHLYGFGPVEYLSGEILIIDGISYQSTVISDEEMKVEESYDIKAPFFAYANILNWSGQALPDSIHSIQELEIYLDKTTNSINRPFIFKLSGTVESARIHIVNLPKGSKVSSPEEAHQGLQDYFLNEEKVDIIGFFSTEHKAIFTHHDTYLHMHLITSDRSQMGHLDEVIFKNMKLHLPKG